jgi:hypothetical protein
MCGGGGSTDVVLSSNGSTGGGGNDNASGADTITESFAIRFPPLHPLHFPHRRFFAEINSSQHVQS